VKHHVQRKQWEDHNQRESGAPSHYFECPDKDIDDEIDDSVHGISFRRVL
jgi:hypothetical protein